MRFWHRFDLAVATISIVRVIFAVLEILRIFFLRSRALAMSQSYA